MINWDMYGYEISQRPFDKKWCVWRQFNSLSPWFIVFVSKDKEEAEKWLKSKLK